MTMYLLLRNNKQSGPHSLEELKSMGLKAYDLVWLEGKSAAWRYPCEIPELSSFAPAVEEQPFDRFYKKATPSVAESAVNGDKPLVTGKRIIYVNMPAGRTATAHLRESRPTPVYTPVPTYAESAPVYPSAPVYSSAPVYPSASVYPKSEPENRSGKRTGYSGSWRSVFVSSPCLRRVYSSASPLTKDPRDCSNELHRRIRRRSRSRPSFTTPHSNYPLPPPHLRRKNQ